VKPVLFVTGHAPAYRVGAFARLHERELIELALFGGGAKHGGAAFEGTLPLPHRPVHPRELYALAASGRYRAVVCPTGGRLAPAAAWAGARRARVPLLLWASLWAHPRSVAHALTYLPLRRLYRAADAVVTYGPHVSAYVRAAGARNVHVAPQSVDNDFWRAPARPPEDLPPWLAAARLKVLFVGRAAPEKGLDVLLAAWLLAGLRPPSAALLLAGPGQQLPGARGSDRDGGRASRGGVLALEPVDPLRLRSIYAACDALVLPSVRTRTFREPWGLVVNEAMNRGLAVVASDAVGAVAGGLVRDGVNGLIVPAGDAAGLGSALRRLAADEQLRGRLGAAAAEDVLAFSHEAWADGFAAALASVGAARARW
jgi:glycosyltransferase involved in cell wall biosynthesis